MSVRVPVRVHGSGLCLCALVCVCVCSSYQRSQRDAVTLQSAARMVVHRRAHQQRTEGVKPVGVWMR